MNQKYLNNNNQDQLSFQNEDENDNIESDDSVNNQIKQKQQKNKIKMQFDYNQNQQQLKSNFLQQETPQQEIKFDTEINQIKNEQNQQQHSNKQYNEDLSQIKNDDQDNEDEEDEDNFDQINYINNKVGGSKPNHQQNNMEDQIYNLYIQPSRDEISIINQITEEIEEKIHALEKFVKDQSDEQIVSVRIQQLALVQTLVLTYGKSPIKLVHAYIQLGEAYINYNCYQQAINNLTIALYKNKKLIVTTKVNQIFWDNIMILQLLGQSYMELDNLEESMNYFNDAYDRLKENKQENDGRIIPILSFIAKCYTKQEQYQTALEYIDLASRVIESVYGSKSVQSALAFIESGKIQGKMSNLDIAIELYNKGIEMLIEKNYDFPENVAELYLQQGKFYELKHNYEGLISCLNNVKQIYMQIYGQMDKRVIKIQQQIAIILFKNEQFDPALQYLNETKQIQAQVYGETSIQVAKTKKIIGTIHVLKQDYNEAEKNFQESIKIFESYGMKQAATEINGQLKLLYNMGKKDQDDIKNISKSFKEY